MRIDGFSLFMHMANIRPGSNILLFEMTRGLIAGTVALRLNNLGNLTYCL